MSFRESFPAKTLRQIGRLQPFQGSIEFEEGTSPALFWSVMSEFNILWFLGTLLLLGIICAMAWQPGNRRRPHARHK